MGGCQSKNDSYRGFVQTLAGIHFKLFANEVKFDLLLGPGTFGSRHLFCYQRYLKEQAKSGPWTMTGMKLHFFCVQYPCLYKVLKYDMTQCLICPYS
jgi:hypothetical protein